MTTPAQLLADAKAISTSSGKIRTFALDTANYLAALDARTAKLEQEVAALQLGIRGTPLVVPPSGDPTIDGRWYSTTSAFNTPIPGAPSIHSNNANFITGLTWLSANAGGTPFGLTISSVPAIGTATGSEALVNVNLNFPTCNASPGPYPIRMPSFVVEQVNESHAIVVFPDGTQWNFFKLTPPGVSTLTSGGPAAGACTSSTAWGCTVIAQTTWTGNGYPVVGGRASQTSDGAGLIRLRDIQTAAGGTWDHALALSYGGTADGNTSGIPKFVAPASGGDGTNHSGALPGNECLPLGARLQLDPAFVIPGSWPEWQQQLARTLKVYGAIVIDSTTSSGALISQYQSAQPAGGGPQAFQGINGFDWANNNMPTSIHASMRVIDWNVWTGA